MESWFAYGCEKDHVSEQAAAVIEERVDRIRTCADCITRKQIMRFCKLECSASRRCKVGVIASRQSNRCSLSRIKGPSLLFLSS